MAKKRQYLQDGDGPRKRPRLVHEAPTFEEIQSARQLMQLLAFSQDLQKARHGLQSFKLILDKINDPDRRTLEDAALLQSYLTSTAPREGDFDHNDEEGDAESIYLPDIMDTWDFAARMNNDNLMSAVPVVLALLIKYLSHVLDMAPMCLGICRTLLRRRQLELIARNLSADKGKEFVISPTLRMLREVISFDGGVLAKSVFRARNYTYRSLSRNMGIRFLGDGVEDTNHTSTRTNAVRFFLASLKFLHPEAKAELLSHREVVGALLRTIKDDPPYVVHDTLATLRMHVVNDKKLARPVKTKLLNASTLTRIASLYSYAYDSATLLAEDEYGSNSNYPPPVSDATHEFLLHVCTSPAAGVLREQGGMYPEGVEPRITATGATSALALEDDIETGVGLDRVAWVDKAAIDIPVRNLVLADFIPNLRPWSSTRHSELLVSIFKEAPELIAWYYANKRSFTFEPKISATWVGFAALLFSTIQVDLPLYFGNKHEYACIPPPTSVIVDSILPLPLTQKILGRCLAHKSKLIPFFTMRLLAVSMEKLRLALHMYDEAARKHRVESFWSESRRRVIDEFCRRCPFMKDIINVYRGIPTDNLLYREVTSRVLRLYYEVVPQVALLSKLDISPHLFAGIRQVEEHQGSSPDKTLKLMELENLLAIAGYSPGMQWFSNTKGLVACPYVALLKVHTEATAELASRKTGDILDFVAREQQLVLSNATSTDNSTNGITALLSSLKPKTGSKTQPLLSSTVWAFVDNCVVRCANGPIKYIEMIQTHLAGASENTYLAHGLPPFDPITMAMAEQLRFVIADASKEAIQSLADFLLQYLEHCRGSYEAMKPVLDMISSAFPERMAYARNFSRGFSKRSHVGVQLHAQKMSANSTNRRSVATRDENNSQEEEKEYSHPGVQNMLEDLLNISPVRSLDTLALAKWTTKPTEELVEEGYASALVMLLTSEDVSIRRQALVNLVNMAAKIRESTYDEKEQVWLLMSELVESTRSWMMDKESAELPVPSHIVSFACHALEVLRNPLHCLYGKVNTFLTTGPIWRMHAFPLVHDIVHDGPTNDDSYYAEINWLLSYLLDGLRTPADVGRFRTRRLFETILSVASNPYMRSPLRRQVLRIICSAASIEGGSTTLITRSGIISWLAVVEGTSNSSRGKPRPADQTKDRRSRGRVQEQEDGNYILSSLLQELWSTCDKEHVENWSMHGIQDSIGGPGKKT